MATSTDMLRKQLSEFPRTAQTLVGNNRVAAGAIAVALVAVIAAAVFVNAEEGYQYAFTNLTADDGAEIGTALRTAQIPFRLEAGGTALAVPPARVYDARLILAAAGLPRSGGTGFELFDRADLGVSEFTQKVNLRRATEGELARTLGRLAGVRSARIHLTLPEHGLFRDEDRSASAAVVLNLQPGKSLDERELAGVRHLVASAVPSLGPNNVTIVDGRGAVLVSEPLWGEEAGAYQRKLERDLEQRILGILEPAVGTGQVVARVTATIDSSEVNTTTDIIDPEASALRSERTMVNTLTQDTVATGGIAGAAANQPLAPTAAPGGARSNSNAQEESRNFDISKTTTRTVARAPRLQRLSVAIMLDGVDGKARSDVEVTRLGELAKRAVGLDAARGDMFDISSGVFTHSAEETPMAAPSPVISKPVVYGGVGVGALAIIVVAVLLMRRNSPVTAATLQQPVLRAGASVAELEAGEGSAIVPKPQTALLDPAIAFRDRARELARVDPVRAAHLLRSWMADDSDVVEVNRG